MLLFIPGSKSEALDVVGSQLSVCQLASVLEVIHALTGLVRTGFVTPLVQVCVCVGGDNIPQYTPMAGKANIYIC